MATQEVDKILAPVAAALVAGSLVFLSLNKPIDEFAKYTFSLSLMLAGFSLILTIWNIVRAPRRDMEWKYAKEELDKKWKGTVNSFVTETIEPLMSYQWNESNSAREERDDNGKLIGWFFKEGESHKEELINTFHKVFDSQQNNLTAQLLQHMREYKDKQEECYSRPLNENFATIKLFLDLSARKFRVYAFIFSVVVFVTSVIYGIFT